MRADETGTQPFSLRGSQPPARHPACSFHARRRGRSLSSRQVANKRRELMKIARKALLGAVGAFLMMAGGQTAAQAQAQETIKIGILHSLSGTMAISETILKDLMLMQVAELNAKGGLLGKKVEGRGGRSRLQLAAVRREGARVADQGQGCRGVRLLDLGQPQVGAAGVRGAERPSLLSARIRGRGSVLQHLLRQLGPRQQGDPGRRVPDEQGRRRGEALRARRHRLRLPRAPATRSSVPSSTRRA